MLERHSRRRKVQVLEHHNHHRRRNHHHSLRRLGYRCVHANDLAVHELGRCRFRFHHRSRRLRQSYIRKVQVLELEHSLHHIRRRILNRHLG